MNDKGEAEIGQTVYLRPQTKQAPTVCYQRLAAVVVSYDAWPYVLVRVFDQPGNERGRETQIHRLNIGLHRKTTATDKTGGDSVQGDEGPKMVGKRIAIPVPPIDPSSGYDQPMLPF